MCRTAAAARGRRRDCTCKLCQVAHPFPIQRSLLSMRPSDSNGSTWESSPRREHTHSHTGSIGSAVPEDVRKRKRGERRRRRRRRRTEGGGASTASQEAGGRVAMQMGSIHIANHWSLSALQRKSLFRQNSRNWSYVPQPWFLSQPLPTLPVQSLSIHSPVWTFMSSKRKESKTRMQDELDSFLLLLLSLLFFHSLLLFFLLLPSLSLSVNFGKLYDNSPVNVKNCSRAVQPNPCLSIAQEKCFL